MPSIAYQMVDVLRAMEADAGMAIPGLRVDGGASANNYLLQVQADLCGAPVQRPHCVETTAMGAAYLAGLGVGYWDSLEQIEKNWRCDRVFAPQITQQERETRLTGWQKAVTEFLEG